MESGREGPNLKEKPKAGEVLCAAAQAYMEAHSAEKFSLDEMAKALFVNGSYLMRAFKRHTGTTPLSYHHMIRCQKAKELLQKPELSIGYIASEVGYVSASHFTQVFRKVTGQTPSRYRATYLRSLDE